MQLQQITIAAPSPLAKRPVTLRRGKEECARPAPAKIGKILGARQGILGDDYVYLRKPSAKFTRSVPKEYIAKNGHDVTAKFLDYVRPIVGDLPKCEIL